MAVRLAAVLPAFLAALCVAAAQADVRITSLSGPEAPIPPETSPVVALAIEADCSSLLARLPPGSTQPVAAPIRWRTEGDLYITGQDRIDIPVDPCLDGAAAAPANATFQLTASRTTPALRPLTVTATVVLGDVQGLAGLPLDIANDSATLQASAAANLVSSLDVPLPNQACACPEVGFEVRLQNLGNTRVSYRFEVTRAPPAEEGWNIRLPEPVVLESPLTPGATPEATAAIVVVPPTGEWNLGSFQVAVRPSAAEDPSIEGGLLTFGLLASNPDFGPRYESTPGPAGLSLGLLLVGLALVARRRD